MIPVQFWAGVPPYKIRVKRSFALGSFSPPKVISDTFLTTSETATDFAVKCVAMKKSNPTPSVDEQEFPLEIGSRNAIVKIYRSKNKHGYTSYQFADYTSGKRKLKTFSDLAKAKKAAGEVAKRLNDGDVDVLELRSTDRASYLRGMELLPPGISLEVACAIIAEGHKLVGNRILEACRLLHKKDPANLPVKTVKEVVSEFVAFKRANKFSEEYVADLDYRLGKFSEAFQCNIGSVLAPEIQNWLHGLKDRKDRKLTNRSLINFQRVLGTLFKYAKRRGYLPRDHDEIGQLERIKAHGGEVTIYTPEELNRLINAAHKRFLPALVIGAFAGLRSAEVLRLDWTEVHLADRYIEIKAGKAKTASRRLVPIPENLAAWLSRFGKRSGRIWKGSNHAFYQVQQKTARRTKGKNLKALEWKHNALRHSYISYRLAETADAAKVAFEAGNSATMVHRHYKQLVTQDAAKKWFGIGPSKAKNVIVIPKTITQATPQAAAATP